MLWLVGLCQFNQANMSRNPRSFCRQEVKLICWMMASSGANTGRKWSKGLPTQGTEFSVFIDEIVTRDFWLFHRHFFPFLPAVHWLDDLIMLGIAVLMSDAISP